MANESTFDQWSTIRKLISASDGPVWVPERDKVRITAYQKYEEIYFNDDRAFQLMRRGAELEPVLVPNPRTIVDTTAHYLLKGVDVSFKADKAQKAAAKWMRKQHFASKFAVAKHSGVCRGDWVFHITVDKEEPEGEQIQLISVDPAAYFPMYDPDDLDKIVGVNLAEVFEDDDGEERIKKRTYRIEKVNGQRRISVEENVYENDRKWKGRVGDWGIDGQLTIARVVVGKTLLPEDIVHIPVYHFRNADWQGQPYGSSELRGFERISASINQTLTDEEMALALEGLGVYYTDAGTPKDDQGNEQPWEIAPARVLELPTGAKFGRAEGIKSITPMLEHATWLYERTMEASATFRAGSIDAQVAESGIALAIRFMPTLAKLEERDLTGSDMLSEMFEDWTMWEEAYEGGGFSGEEPVVTLGSKLPLNREERVSELNNMLDRNVISRAFFRTEMNKLGYEIPDDIQDEIDEELENLARFKPSGTAYSEPQQTEEEGSLPSGNPSNPNQPTLPKPPSRSNNRGKVNESDGTEAKQSLNGQAKARR